ncbi:hypothetical protein DES34_11620 [Brevibacillus brevis]|nr:hypothetical protein DES34_11620 [Brevibacillus brevis]TQK62670.1 hypothetical protein FB479_105454 [Brevibacillus sp. AG162]VEF87684.1 Uncharacterised protein [Brevibacillus brevis]
MTGSLFFIPKKAWSQYCHALGHQHFSPSSVIMDKIEFRSKGVEYFAVQSVN